jgi:hypothetical protein
MTTGKLATQRYLEYLVGIYEAEPTFEGGKIKEI